MASQRQNITISAPAFRGLNTQDSPITLDASYASIANNCIIDQYGRIGSRKGLNLVTGSASLLGSSVGIEVMKEYFHPTASNVMLSAGNNKIFTGTTTLVDVTPSAYSITSNNWKIVNFNDHAFFFQIGYEPLVYSSHDNTVTKMSSHAGSSGTPPQGNEALAAYGRLWVADFTTDKSTIYWSDLLDGTAWTGGTTGSLDITKVWPNGVDEIVALSAHNDFLIIFGKNSIVVYSGATDPATMSLVDTLANIGCTERDAVTHTGTDLLFLSSTGIRSFGRTIQESSLPMRDVSKNVRNDLLSVNALQTASPVRSVYSPEEAFYLISFSDSNYVFCFDMRFPMEDGSFRVTTWPDFKALCLIRAEDGKVYIGGTSGISEYTGHYDYSLSFEMQYYSNPLTFGDSSRLKMLKDIIITIMGGQNAQASVSWGYDYTNSFTKQSITVDSGSQIAKFNENEFNESDSEYTASIIIDKPHTKTTGSGSVVTIGVDAAISGQALSIQELNIQAIIGRLI